MAEKRLIDAENLLKEYEQIDWYCVSKEGQFMRGATTEDNPFIHYYDGEEIIKNAPTVDAVEVVRCKDCKHMEIDRGGRFCHVWGGYNGMGDDGFCNYGERKEGADDGEEESDSGGV